MLQIRVREKYQVTLPMSIVRGAGIHENDMLEVNFKNGVITLALIKTTLSKKSLMDFVGITQGLYGNYAAEVAQYLEQERNGCDR
jgi:bifunctional DNA-binding transcriptional regulator/antitoxin component of YhaV-PrlF toxin-antitoxin module